MRIQSVRVIVCVCERALLQLPLRDAFRLADEVLRQGVVGCARALPAAPHAREGCHPPLPHHTKHIQLPLRARRARPYTRACMRARPCRLPYARALATTATAHPLATSRTPFNRSVTIAMHSLKVRS
eukprot:134727-Pleurochrysis_carterae.AAC.2